MFLILNLTLLIGFDAIDLSIEILFSLTEGLRDFISHSGLLRMECVTKLSLHLFIVGVQFLSFESFFWRYWMSIKDLNLGHGMNNFQTIVGFLCQGVTEKVKLI